MILGVTPVSLRAPLGSLGPLKTHLPLGQFDDPRLVPPGAAGHSLNLSRGGQRVLLAPMMAGRSVARRRDASLTTRGVVDSAMACIR